jgi:hypothetical protein
METSLDKLIFDQDLEGVSKAEEAVRWTIEHVDLLAVKVTLSPRSSPEEKYEARLQWSAYPGQPPSLAFYRSGTDIVNDPCAWPNCSGFRPSSLDSCVHWTAEGHRLHPEWASAAATRWPTSGNALFRAICFLQDTLDYSYYGRHRQ